jgi:hypothetical protein
MKTTITYSVSDLMSFKTWAEAVTFANRINYKIIKVTGTKGANQVEKGYTIDTWKNSQANQKRHSFTTLTKRGVRLGNAL